MHKPSSNLAAANPKLSVVLASQNAKNSVVECLTVLESQRGGREIEFIVADNSTDGTTEIINTQFPDVRLLNAPKDSLIPELWELAICASNGDVIALTTTHFIPTNNWIEEILKAHDSPYSGIGGAIENDESEGIVSWAIYFCRYSAYMLPFEPRVVDDFAADNASYKRRAIERCEHARRGGFWESFIHAELRREGLQLLKTPNIVMRHKKSFSFSGFMKQRFRHGRQFGSTRRKNISGFKRMIYTLFSPLIPCIFMWRITRQVANKRRHVKEFFLSLPVLTLFLLSWAVGELSGYVWMSASRK